MNLQMQLKRGFIALAIWAVLGGIVLSRASGSADTATGDRAAAAIRAALRTGSRCETSLRIDMSQSVRVTLPCDWSCAPVREVMHVLHVPVHSSVSACQAPHTA